MRAFPRTITAWFTKIEQNMIGAASHAYGLGWDLLGAFLMSSLLLPSMPMRCDAGTPGQEAASNANAVSYWRFSDLGSTYSNGNQLYMQVSKGQTKYLWNPMNQKLTGWLDSYGSRFQKIDDLIGMQPRQLDQKTVILHHLDFSSKTRTSFLDYYELVSDSHVIYSFYLIIGEHNDYFENRFCCDDPYHSAERLRQKYGPAVVVLADNLLNGSLLLTVPTLEPSGVSIIALYKMPESALAFDHNVFLIPKPLIDASLQSAGLSLRARYAVVKHFMAAAAIVKPSLPNTLVPAETFFSDRKE